jgi:hypothetical protein
VQVEENFLNRGEVVSLLDRLHGLLEHPEPLTSNAVRAHVHAITKLLLRTGYSTQLQEADVNLTRAITGFQFGRSETTLDTLRDRLCDYRAAALSSDVQHAPIRPLIEIALAPPSLEPVVVAEQHGADAI